MTDKQSLLSVRIRLRVPSTIYRVYHHPRLGFSLENLGIDIENATDMNLDAASLFDLDALETTKTTITVRRHFLTIYEQLAKRRRCSIEVLINSALAQWFEDSWYSDGHPKTFMEICKKLAVDDLTNSNDDTLLSLLLTPGFFDR